MGKIGMFFGTETGSTRLVAKKMQKKLGDELCAKPVNVNRSSIEQMLGYDSLILGTPSYGVGEIPGKSAGCFEPNWEEFFATVTTAPDFTGKRIVFFGLGAQERYADRFASSLLALVQKFKAWGAEIVGEWPLDGYAFEQSAAVVDGRFLGLIIDQRTQGMLTDERIDAWLAQIKPLLLEKIEAVA